MTSEYPQWAKLKNNYLKQVEQALASTNHPKSNDVLRDVDEHLERKYTELEPDKQNWEGYQQILIEMGPPDEYAELLSEETTAAVKNTSGINTFLAAVFVIVLIIVGGYLIYNAKNAPAPATTSRVVEFEPDERVLGKWITVDFVQKIEYFKPEQQQWIGDLYLKGLTFYEDGTTSGPWTWTQGLLIHPGDHTSARYVIKSLQGANYLFMEWISGDVTIRREQPWYYVLKKEE